MTELNSTNIERILTDLSREILNGNQVSYIFDNPKEYPTYLIEKLSLETAMRYWNRQINFEDGDCIMTNIYIFWMTNDYYRENYAFSDIAWECYEAFDAGECYVIDDDSCIDSADEYTRPLIENLLRKRNQIA